MSGPTPFPFALGDITHPEDITTAAKNNADPAMRASDALATNPMLRKDPTAAKAFLNQPVGDGHTVGMATKFAKTYSDSHRAVADAASSQNQHAHGWLQGLWHDALSGWNWAADSVVSGTKFVGRNLLSPPAQTQAQKERDQAFTNTTKALGWSVLHGVKRTLGTFTELGSLGQVNAQGQANGNIGANLSDAGHTILNAANQTVNPFTVYRNMAHTAAFAESLARRKGWAYTFATLAPYLAVAMVTHTALVGEMSSEEAASQIASMSEQATAEGATLTPEQQALTQQAHEVVAGATPESGIAPNVVKIHETPNEAPPGTIPAPETGPSFAPNRSGIFRGASRMVGTVSRPLGALGRIAGTLAKPGADLRLNAMYTALHGGMTADTANKPLWDATAGGNPIDENGNIIPGGVGGQIASYLGLPQGAAASIFATPINIYANYLGADPLGAAGKLIGATRTFDSVGGVVGRMFGGMGIRVPEDVSRIVSQYRRAQNTVDFMASHSAGQIDSTFRGMFLGTEGRKVLNLLGAATTRDEVIKIFEDMSQGLSYAHNTMPGLSGYQLMKANFRYGDVTKQVGDALAQPANELHSEASSIEGQTGNKVWPPDSANFAVAQGPIGAQVRERSILGNFFSKRLVSNPMYYNEALGKMESYDMHMGSTGLSSAIGDQLTRLGRGPAAVAIAQDAILNASIDEANKVILNIYAESINAQILSKLKVAASDQVRTQLMSDINTQVSQWMGATSSGERGVMASDLFGEDHSVTLGHGGERNSALGETQQAALHFPRTRDIQGYINNVANIVNELGHAQDGALGVDLHLGDEALQTKAAFANSNLTGLAARLTGKIGTLASSSSDSKSAFDAKMTELASDTRKALDAVPEGDTIGHNLAFVKVFENVRQNLDDIKRTVNLVDEWNLQSKVLGNNEYERQLQLQELNAKLPKGPLTSVDQATPEMLSKLRGELSALEDTTAEMTARLQKESVTLKDIQSHIKQMYPDMNERSAELLAQKTMRLRETNPRYRNNWQTIIDGANYYQSKIFVPMALFSGGWAVRVGNSEMLLNTFRAGAMKMFQDKLLTSYVKHETGRSVFTGRMDGMLARHVNANLFKGTFKEMLARKDLTYAQKLVGSTARTVGGLIIGMRDLAGGTLHGIEGNLINWTPRTQRMFDRVMGAVNEYAPGGLPGGVHGTGGIVEDGSVPHGVSFGDDETGKSVASLSYKNRHFEGINPQDSNYARGLRGTLSRIHDDSYMAPPMARLQQLTGGGNKIVTRAELNSYIDEMTKPALAHIESRPLTELQNFDRHTRIGKMALSPEEVIAKLSDEQKARFAAMSEEERQTFLNHYDWARSIAYHDISSVTGIAGNDRYIIHGDLVDQAVSGQVLSVFDMRKLVDSMKERTEPRNIPTEVFSGPGAISTANTFVKRAKEGGRILVGVPQMISEAGFRTIFGPMVNSYVRDPVYLSIFDDEAEKLQTMVDHNLISEETQKIRAHENAMVKMSKFVHNPLDRTAFESDMRAFAPFYFAQNQAWRRAFRVASTDPGAFEKYLRASLATTNFVSVMGQSGSAPIHVPGTQFVGALGGLGSGMMPNQLGSLGFSLAASVGSISSVIPTGSEAGLGVLENVVRPSWGPLVTVTLKEGEHLFGLQHVPWANKLITDILGPIASNTGLLDEVLPSTIFRNTAFTAEGLFHVNNSGMASATMYTLNNAIDNKSMMYYDKALKEADAAGFPPSMAKKVARAIADKQTADFFNLSTNGTAVHAFMDQVHMAAVLMYGVKTVLGFGSPLALSLQQTFSKQTEFQAILNEKKPDGSPKYTFEEASVKFANEFPNHIYDLVAHSKPAGSDYAETKSALNLLQNTPYVPAKYPNAAAYLISRDGTYSPQAYQLELSMRLRSRYNMGDAEAGYGPNNPGGAYFQALMHAAGNDYYYNWLSPQYPNTPGNQGYNNYKALDAKAKSYGRFDNPDWYGYFQSGAGKWATEAQAVDQMGQMLTDKNVPDSVYGGAQSKNLYETLLAMYYQTVAQYQSAQSNSEKYQIETGWYNQMTRMSSVTGGAITPAMSYFITSVLRNLPTAKK